MRCNTRARLSSGRRRAEMSGMLKASAIVTKVVRACVKESLQPKMAHEGKMYYTVIKYAEGAKETSRESFGVKE
ncbi:hypothetical protein JL722_4155 [Aureococcus anophagefferens]|nr:hypothetical protein JL722_4155 [Aureococcus anophagefferens]